MRLCGYTVLPWTSNPSVESKEVIFLHAVIPIPPRNAGVRTLMKLKKVLVIWLCPILYPRPILVGQAVPKGRNWSVWFGSMIVKLLYITDIDPASKKKTYVVGYRVWLIMVGLKNGPKSVTSGFTLLFAWPKSRQKVKAANKKALRPSSRLSAAEWSSHGQSKLLRLTKPWFWSQHFFLWGQS